MSLLEDIQVAAVDASTNVGTLLRKCKLLAARLRNQPLEKWVTLESNGYPDDVEVPDYRIWPLEVKGHFVGPLGSGLRNAPIPFVCLPEEMRAGRLGYECRQSIASIEATLEKLGKDGKDIVRFGTGDLAVVLGTNVYQGHNCIQASSEFGSGALVELVNGVRNRILDFSLAVWKEEPAAADMDVLQLWRTAAGNLKRS